MFKRKGGGQRLFNIVQKAFDKSGGFPNIDIEIVNIMEIDSHSILRQTYNKLGQHSPFLRCLPEV